MKATISIVLTMVLVLSVPLSSFAQQHRRTVPKCEVCAEHGVSQAVVFGTFATLHQFQARLNAGQARSRDAQAALTSLRILFAHLDETGVTKAVEQSLLANEEKIIVFSPTRADAEALQKHHANFGINRTIEEETAQLASSTVNDRMQAIALIKKDGLHGVYEQILARYEGAAVRLLAMEKSGKPFQLRTVVAQGGGCKDYETVAAIFSVPCAFGCAGCCIVAAVAHLAYVICEQSGGNF